MIYIIVLLAVCVAISLLYVLDALRTGSGLALVSVPAPSTECSTKAPDPSIPGCCKHGTYKGFCLNTKQTHVYDTNQQKWTNKKNIKSDADTATPTTATPSTTTTTTVPTDTTTTTTTTTTPTTGGGGGGGGGGGDCLAIFNKYRAMEGKPPLQAATAEQIACANRVAANNAVQGYHAQTCGGAQCECMNGVRGPNGETGLEGCVAAYYDEKRTGAQNMGHFLIMSGNYKTLACGTDGKGFYSHQFF